MSDFQDFPDRAYSLINLLFEAAEVIRWNQLFKIQFPSTISSWRGRWWGEVEVEVEAGGVVLVPTLPPAGHLPADGKMEYFSVHGKMFPDFASGDCIV